MANDAAPSEATLADEGAPLPSEEAPPASPTPARPAPPPFKFSTMVLMIFFFLGIIMIFDTQTRNQVADLLGLGLGPLIGFGHHYVLLTMFCAALIEMLFTAIAYNWATDWVKTSRIQSWSSAFRKVQMEALRSGKKDRVEALKPHQAEITRLSSELSISQLKGMAITWFLVIAIYTWVGIFIGESLLAQRTVDIGGVVLNLAQNLHIGPFPIPYWIVLFSLYTFPLSYVLRRSLKHYSLRRYEIEHLSDAPSPTGPTA